MCFYMASTNGPDGMLSGASHRSRYRLVERWAGWMNSPDDVTLQSLSSSIKRPRRVDDRLRQLAVRGKSPPNDFISTTSRPHMFSTTAAKRNHERGNPQRSTSVRTRVEACCEPGTSLFVQKLDGRSCVGVSQRMC